MIQIICEWGQSHRGNLDVAKAQARLTKAMGATFSKWQLFEPERLVSVNAKRYWNKSLGGDESQLKTFKNNGSLAKEEWQELKAYCDDSGVGFLVTPFDLQAVDFLEDIGVSHWKIASGEITHKPLIQAIAQTKKPVFLSTGASLIWEIMQALEFLDNNLTTLLACDLVYPCPPADANLSRIPALRKSFPFVAGYGYSDHTREVETGLAAAALGATVLEKHCTLDWKGGVPDDRMALEPIQMREYIRLARLGNQLVGYAFLRASGAEQAAKIGARRSAHAARDIPVGKKFEPEDIIFLRPCPPNGIPPTDADSLFHKNASRAFKSGEMIIVSR